MARICEHIFEQEDPENKGFSMTEFDLCAALNKTIRKDLKRGLYQIASIDSENRKVVFYESKYLKKIVSIANMMEKPFRHGDPAWIRIECRGNPCSEASDKTPHAQPRSQRGDRFEVFWKGKLIDKFPTRAEAETYIGIESTQMEFAECTPEELKAGWEIKEVSE